MSASATIARQSEAIHFTLQTIMACLNAADRSQIISMQMIAALKKKCEKKNMEVFELKSLIQEINTTLPSDHAPFPPFDFDPSNQLKNHVIAFEFFLNLLLKSGDLLLDQEAPLFSESLLLWRDINEKLGLKEATAKFAELIQKANSYLSNNQQFPIPKT